MLHWPNTFKVQSNSQELKQATVRILNFASSQEGTESRKLISPAIQPLQSSFSAGTYESGHNSGKLDYNTWALPEKSQCYSSLIITLTCPGSSVTTSSLHTAHLHALGFFQKCSRNHFNTQCLPQPSSSWQLLQITNRVWILWPLSVHLNRNDLMIKVSHCLKIAGRLNWKKHTLLKQQIELELLCALIGHFFGEANKQLWEKKHQLRRKCLLDIYLSKSHFGHNGRAMGVKNGNQDGFTRSYPRDFHSIRLRISVSVLINQAQDVVFPFAWILWGFFFLVVFIALNARSNFTVEELQMWQFIILWNATFAILRENGSNASHLWATKPASETECKMKSHPV